MGDCKSIVPASEGEHHVVAAFQHLVRVLGASENMTVELKKLLSDLDSHLTSMTPFTHLEVGKLNELEKQFKSAEKKIRRWESNQSTIWDCGPMEACEYLKAIDEIHKVQEGLRCSSINECQKQKELIFQADSVLQIAMARLELELIHILAQHKLYFDTDNIPFQSGGYDVVYDESFNSAENNLAVENSLTENIAAVYVVNLVHPHVIPHLKSIANVMFASNYIQEFCKTFVDMRKDALDEYLFILEMDMYSIRDLLSMEWNALNMKIKKWIWVVKVIIRVYLASERRLCKDILEGIGSISSVCFTEIAVTSMFRLLDFGEAIAMEPHRPEKLFRLLDMYEVLENLLEDIDALFSEDTEMGSFLKGEFHKLFKKLGDSARTTFVGFGNVIASCISTDPFPGGAVHHLTKYVMNYIKTLTIYSDSLNFLLRDEAVGGSNPASELQNKNDKMHCPMACHSQSITSHLISNLNNKSKLYKDDALQHIFLMNNIHYIVQKVKGPELSLFFGNEWIKDHTGMFRKHATMYVRVTWLSVLFELRDENQGTGNISKASLKEKYRTFIAAFEEIYKNQTGWNIPDPELREELRIQTSNHVIQAYRAFAGNSHLSREKFVKHTDDDLARYLEDLFRGRQRSLQPRRR